MILSSTMMSDFSTCLKRGQYRWVDKLVTKPRDLGVPLRRGIWLHRCLEVFHQGGHWEEELTRMESWAEEHGVDAAKALEISDECYDIMRGYIDYWPQGLWTVLQAEEPIELSFGPDAGIRATIDLRVQTKDGIFLVEHKSTSEIPPASWRSVDPQTALQYWLCLQKGLPVDGIIFNYLLTKKPAEPRWKKDGTLYANSTPTTSAAFERGMVAAGKEYNHDGVPQAEAQLVNDGLFYQRYTVLRPLDNVRETMQDVLDLLEDINAARKRGHYRRSFHPLTCRRFCPYASICIHEYLLGKESPTLRDELFMIDDGSRGEGR